MISSMIGRRQDSKNGDDNDNGHSKKQLDMNIAL